MQWCGRLQPWQLDIYFLQPFPHNRVPSDPGYLLASLQLPNPHKGRETLTATGTLDLFLTSG